MRFRLSEVQTPSRPALALWWLQSAERTLDALGATSGVDGVVGARGGRAAPAVGGCVVIDTTRCVVGLRL